MGLNKYHIRWIFGTQDNWRNKNPGSRFGAPAELPIQPIYLKIWPNWQNRQCCLAGSSKTAPRILIFSIAMDADYSFHLKTIEACTFLTLNILPIGRVICKYATKTLAQTNEHIWFQNWPFFGRKLKKGRDEKRRCTEMLMRLLSWDESCSLLQSLHQFTHLI